MKSVMSIATETEGAETGEEADRQYRKKP